MKNKYITISILLFYEVCTSGLYAQSNIMNVSNNQDMQKTDSKIVIGATEHIKIEPPELTLRARIDTGAKTTSIDARNIIPFERDGKKWVKFSVYDGDMEYKVERPVYDTVRIKRHGEKSQRRYMIKIRVTAGDISQLIRVSLTDRSKYEFPILIGRNFLKDYFIVDVSKYNVLKKLQKSKKEINDTKLKRVQQERSNTNKQNETK